MKLLLIETGGFLGKSKMAELDLNDMPKNRSNVIKQYFEEHKTVARPRQTKKRDNYEYFWNYNNRMIPVNQEDLPDEIEQLFLSMKENLAYRR